MLTSGGWVAVVAAPFVGSFLGVLILRLPRARTVVWGRSCCEGCGARLGVAELVPVASYVWQGGRCRRCGGAIDPLHWRVEVAATLVALAAWGLGNDAGAGWGGCVLGWGLLTLGWIDARTMLLPDALTLPLLLAGLAATWLGEREALAEHALAAALGYGAFAGLAALYRRFRGRDGMGGGDAKLLAAGGAWLGLAALPWVVFAAAAGALVGAVLSGGIVATRRVPFGPWLAAAIWLIYLIMRG